MLSIAMYILMFYFCFENLIGVSETNYLNFVCRINIHLCSVDRASKNRVNINIKKKYMVTRIVVKNVLPSLKIVKNN